MMLDSLLKDTALERILRHIAVITEQEGYRLWLVGGVVRDLLLGYKLDYDFDFAIDGDVNGLSEKLVASCGGSIIAKHTAFGTATIELPYGLDGQVLAIDLARTRSEQYPRPAVLPVVQPASIEEDLFRRDFSMNALALELKATAQCLEIGELLDPFNGRADLAAGVLRLLHPASLSDDPTRVLRGLRLAARLGLRVDPMMYVLLQEAVEHNYFALLSNERIMGELCLALMEPSPDSVLDFADDWRVTPLILPGLQWSERIALRFSWLRNHAWPVFDGVDQRLLRLGLLLYDLDIPVRDSLIARYPLPNLFVRFVKELDTFPILADKLNTRLTYSEIDALLQPISVAGIAVLCYAEPAVSERVLYYLQKLRPFIPPLNGRDLQRLGIAPGPTVGRVLKALRAACLDGEVLDYAAAEAWVRSYEE